MTRILVGVDFSDGAAYALRRARELARALDAQVVVAHVVDRYLRAEPVQETRAAAWLEENGLTLTEVVVRHGSAWVELVRHAREIGPAMVVVGSHGTSGFQPLALGSTAAKLTVLSPYPVLVVTSAAGDGRPAAPKAAVERRVVG